MKNKQPLHLLADLHRELAHYQEAVDLLTELWNLGGPYSDTIEVPTKLRYRLQDFFGFDDSE